MWVRIDDEMPDHPKQLAASAALGPDGPTLALGFAVWGLAYSNRYLTDGFLPTAVVQQCGRVRQPLRVAEVLVAAGIWEVRDGGFYIHDFHDYNPYAAEVKERRERERVRKMSARTRRGHPAPSVECPPGVRADNPRTTRGQPAVSEVCPPDVRADTVRGSCASRARVPRPLPQEREKDLLSPPDRPEDTGPSDALAERAGRFADWYAGKAYPRWRDGAGYVRHPLRDYEHAVRLCEAYPDDDWLRQLAEVYLRTDHPDARKVARTIGQFAALAGWCDASLRQQGQRPATPAVAAGAPS